MNSKLIETDYNFNLSMQLIIKNKSPKLENYLWVTIYENSPFVFNNCIGLFVQARTEGTIE